ncbi:40s ribosomal protein s21 [Nannochloropsis gaditana]|uniref:40S ribosomal protein S21 n=1 Tax=Nannochloropsis gaditana TaxID=72520 RepID=W7TTZ6_9STRA|nr:40s ribosomal protein s21 [Nannochloropsis gaditana]
MQNEAGQNVDLYIPRKCSWTNRVIHSKDHAAVQVNVANVDASGVYLQGDLKTIAMAGYIRAKGEADAAMTEMVKKADSEQ